TFLVNAEAPFGFILGTPTFSKGFLLPQNGGFPSRREWSVAELAPGESATAQVTYEFFRQDTPDSDTEVIDVIYTSRSTTDLNDLNDQASLTFTRDDGSEVCPLDFSLDFTPINQGVAPGETFSLTGTFTNFSNQSLAASTIAFYNFIYDENGILLERRPITSLGSLPTFAPNESKELTITLTVNDPINFTFSPIFTLSPSALVANANAAGRAEDSQWWNICKNEYRLRFDFPDVDLSVGFTNNSECYGDDDIIQTDAILRNNGLETVAGPFVLRIGQPDQVDTSLPGLSIFTFETGQEVVEWTINQDLAPGESVTLTRPFRYDNVNSNGVFIRLSLNEFGDELENIGTSFTSQFFEFEADCGTTAPICSGDVRLTTQAQVDAFGPCDVFDGNLTIEGVNIRSLSSLGELTRVTGQLNIRNTNLNNLSGLGSLQQVAGLGISDNAFLTNVSNLVNLTQATEVLSIINNDRLTSIEGLENVTQAGVLNVVNNELLTTLSPLASLTNINTIIITDNPNLENLSAFSNVSSLRTLLLISNPQLNAVQFSSLSNVNEVLQIIGSNLGDLNGLGVLQTVGELTIANNPALANIAALNSLSVVEDLTLTVHPLLTDCCALFPILNNNDVTGRIDISQNGMNCSSVQEILDNCDNTGGLDVDLELSVSTPNANPAIYNTIPLTYTVENTSMESASNIKVRVGVCGVESGNFQNGFAFFQTNGLVFSSPAPTASAGSFTNTSQIWTIPNLAAGESATLTINIFTLTTEERIVLGEIESMNETDGDSTPGNLSTCTISEDDEAQLILNPTDIELLPDLALANLNIPTDGLIRAGDVVDYVVDVQNLGDVTASGSYTITAFLSTDNQLSNNDVEVGVIPTGNTPVGTISDVPGAITVPNNTAEGNYFLIVQTDSDDEISESNEANNTALTTLTIEGDGNNNCQIEALVTNILCDDANTPSDPSDDTFTFDLTINNAGSNGSSPVIVNTQCPI
ncbi:MAG: CARDB domain-containing protein, partial [Saprospiraceae bacterium]